MGEAKRRKQKDPSWGKSSVVLDLSYFATFGLRTMPCKHPNFTHTFLPSLQYIHQVERASPEHPLKHYTAFEIYGAVHHLALSGETLATITMEKILDVIRDVSKWSKFDMPDELYPVLDHIKRIRQFYQGDIYDLIVMAKHLGKFYNSCDSERGLTLELTTRSDYNVFVKKLQSSPDGLYFFSDKTHELLYSGFIDDLFDVMPS